MIYSFPNKRKNHRFSFK